MNREILQQALDALLIGYHRGTHDAIAALREALTAPEPEPVTWQFRWTNPGNKPDVRPHELEWRKVVPTNSMYTVADAAADLLRYEFNGKPCYEVRPLYAAPPAAPATAVPAEDFCYCNDEISLQMVSGGAASEGLYGRLTLKIDGKYVEYVRAESAAPVVREPFSRAQLHRLYVNSPELHKDTASEAAFTRIVQLTEAAHGITGGKP